MKHMAILCHCMQIIPEHFPKFCLFATIFFIRDKTSGFVHVSICLSHKTSVKFWETGYGRKHSCVEFLRRGETLQLREF